MSDGVRSLRAGRGRAESEGARRCAPRCGNGGRAVARKRFETARIVADQNILFLRLIGRVEGQHIFAAGFRVEAAYRENAFLVAIMAISTVSADPPPGSPEVQNSICDTNATPGGICDDYNSNLDATIGPDWSQIAVQLSMESASEIEIEIFEHPLFLGASQ
mgnify:CR=1 FL=1